MWASVAQEEGEEEWMDASRPRHFKDDRLPLDPATLIRPGSAAGAGPASAPGCHALLGAERVVNTHVALRGGCGGGSGLEVNYREDGQGLEEDSSEDRRVAATLEAAEQQGLFMVSLCFVFVQTMYYQNTSICPSSICMNLDINVCRRHVCVGVICLRRMGDGMLAAGCSTGRGRQGVAATGAVEEQVFRDATRKERGQRRRAHSVGPLQWLPAVWADPRRTRAGRRERPETAATARRRCQRGSGGVLL